MKRKYIRQAKQLYKALKQKGQTWTRNRAQLTGWAVEFQEMREDEEISAKRIQRVLDWYCEHGIGALYVPLVGTAESFRARFDDVDEARERLADQELHYFDDYLDYRFSVGRGTPIQREYRQVMQKVEQQIQYVDDLAHNRVKPPKRKAKAKRLKVEPKLLRRMVIVDREYLWGLLMLVPGAAQEFQNRLKRDGLHKRIARHFDQSAAEEAPF